MEEVLASITGGQIAAAVTALMIVVVGIAMAFQGGTVGKRVVKKI
ncbi:hypothetical protein [Pseudomonas sp. PA15(2017)]|nr:hypothetical protein [Pseudomonas sp. PA15(2017)]